MKEFEFRYVLRGLVFVDEAVTTRCEETIDDSVIRADLEPWQQDAEIYHTIFFGLLGALNKG